MEQRQAKQVIADSLDRFANGSLAEDAIDFFGTVGYASEKRIELHPPTAANFRATFATNGDFNADKALLDEWQSVHLLFQLTADEIKATSQLKLDFITHAPVDDTIIESYLFFAIALQNDTYSRTQLATITREVNKLFRMPAIVLFRHGHTLTLSIIDRRLHKRDPSRDVLKKVTLIKDINFSDPHRAHIEILFDLSLERVYSQHHFTNFIELHNAWRKILDTKELNKKFYQELANWYFWALKKVNFPADAEPDKETRNATNVIRLITRLIFVWFTKEKGLVPVELFDQNTIKQLLTSIAPNESTYYKAILQNLFFATLNTEMNKDKDGSREFRGTAKEPGQRDQHYMIHNVFRYEDCFVEPQDTFHKYFDSIPFLNGGLFECLDREEGEHGARETVRIDGFSDRSDNVLSVPNELFFSPEQEVDLNDVYGTKNKRYTVRGIIDILSRYKFTIAENTPIEEEIALDPELLGRVFENLLASYNPETKTTARKQTGSYYTPREIVNYMVDESLIAYLESQLKQKIPALQDMKDLGALLRDIFAYTEKVHPFDQDEVAALIDAIDSIKILDPACGSGAFPMGILHKLVFILAKLDPNNERWKARQVAKASAIQDSVASKQAIDEIEQAFANNEPDYPRKLHLIQDCIYGVDIQPIAVQIAKLRFFISLLVDQSIDDARPNRGILPLPNLETKFVAANSLIGLDRPAQISLRNPAIDQKEKELAEVRKRHFTSRTPGTKAKYRHLDALLRAEISQLLKQHGFPRETTEKLAQWDPYDQNASAGFFDPEWMFDIEGGFDLLITNPPYVRVDDIADSLRPAYKRTYSTAVGKYDLYYLFFEKSFALGGGNGTCAFISPNKFCAAESATTLRSMLFDTTPSGEITSTSRLNVFEAASNYPVVSVLKKGISDEGQFLVRQVDKIELLATKATPRTYLANPDAFRLLPNGVIPINIDQAAFDLVSRLFQNHAYMSGFLGISEGLRIPTSLESESTQDFQIVKQYQFSKYSSVRTGSTISVTNLEKVVGKRSERYNRIMSDKVLIAEDALEINATMDLHKRVPQGGVYFAVLAVPGVSLTFLLGILNSALLSYIYAVLYSGMHMGGGYLRYRSRFLEHLPMPCEASDISADRQNDMSQAVHQILAITKDADYLTNLAKQAKVKEYEHQIDQLVYQLYGLTPEEIEIVEGSTQ